MYTKRSLDEKFNDLEEFIDNIKRGGEVEFIYDGTGYSVTQPEGMISFIKMGDLESERVFKNVQELLEYTIGTEKVKDIIVGADIKFRCF